MTDDLLGDNDNFDDIQNPPDFPLDEPLIQFPPGQPEYNPDFSPSVDTHINYADVLSTNIVELDWGGNNFDSAYDVMSQTYNLDIYGKPFEEIANFDPQDYKNSCAIATTSMMLQSCGYDFGEDLLAEAFEKINVYDPSEGTKLSWVDETINAIAEATDIEFRATEVQDFTVEQLKGMLDSGSKLLVGVDAWELYRDDSITLNEIKGVADSGHAVQLTGIIESENGSSVVINDPGFQNGAGVEIPMERFMNAAADFNNTAIRLG